jgi:effector-binding domain-containing protein
MIRDIAVEARPTLVVPATTTWAEFPRLWKVLLDEVWECLHANGITRGCPNVMFYRDDVPNVEVGVLPAGDVTLSGGVVRSFLPAGRVATTIHKGPWSELGTAHDAIHEWCATQGLTLAGPRWEIYGPHRDDPAELTVEVTWLLAD